MQYSVFVMLISYCFAFRGYIQAFHAQADTIIQVNKEENESRIVKVIHRG
jgi:hypothetical protein